MKHMVFVLVLAALLSACAAPVTPAAPPASQPAATQSLPEVTVFHSPT